MSMNVSLVRTIVPVIYALLIKVGIDALGVKEEDIQALATALATALVYLAIRLGEQLQPKVGWLLGYPAAPTYDVPTGVGDDHGK